MTWVMVARLLNIDTKHHPQEREEFDRALKRRYCLDLHHSASVKKHSAQSWLLFYQDVATDRCLLSW